VGDVMEKQQIIDQVEEYIKSKKHAWARTSLKNERYRLLFHGPRVLEDPKEVYEALKCRQTNHSIKTTFTRLGQFHEFLVETDAIPFVKKNPWKKFLQTNANLFKHAYQTERLKVSYKEALSRIETQMKGQYKFASLQLLKGGLRYCELRTFDGEKVIGKGSKPRAVFLKGELKTFRYTGSYSALYTRLKAIELKPHTLRKLCATEFTRQPGVTDPDTMRVFGWNDIGTSAKYRQALHDSKLSEMLENVCDEKEKPIVKRIFQRFFEAAA
jgi:hypothetical protein